MDSAAAAGRRETPVSFAAVDTAGKPAVGRVVVDKAAVGTVAADKAAVGTVVVYRVAVVAANRDVVAKSSQR